MKRVNTMLRGMFLAPLEHHVSIFPHITPKLMSFINRFVESINMLTSKMFGVLVNMHKYITYVFSAKISMHSNTDFVSLVLFLINK